MKSLLRRLRAWRERRRKRYVRKWEETRPFASRSVTTPNPDVPGDSHTGGD